MSIIAGQAALNAGLRAAERGCGRCIGGGGEAETEHEVFAAIVALHMALFRTAPGDVVGDGASHRPLPAFATYG